MCTLSYLLTETGYELFFNRDEQRTRPLAIAPQYHPQYCAIYPIDPQGKGTWIAVNKQGLTLALLNYYQACKPKTEQTFVSRGQLIPQLMQQALQHPNSSIESLLKQSDLTCYQPFQLAIFPANLTKTTNEVKFYQYDGSELVLTNKKQPFTSSGVDFDYVEKKRKAKFKELVCPNNATSAQFKAFHLSQETEGKYSVNLERFDAKTVSISHICVEKPCLEKQLKKQIKKQSANPNINFHYIDNITHNDCTINLME